MNNFYHHFAKISILQIVLLLKLTFCAVTAFETLPKSFKIYVYGFPRKRAKMQV